MTFGYKTASGEFLDFTRVALLGDLSSWAWDVGDSLSFTYPANDKRTVRLRFKSMAECDYATAKMDNDTRNNMQGQLIMGEWSLKCNLTSGSFVGRNGAVTYDAVFTCYGNRWCRSSTIEFYASTAPVSTGFDYPHDYPIDFSGSPVGESSIEVDSIGACDFRLAIFGPVDNPSITIGGNNYEVNVSVPSGSILFIDSHEKRTPGAEIFMRSSIGVITNQFAARQKGQPGSGTYIFEPIKPGQQSVTWSGRFGFTIELLESRTKAPDDRY
jgi:hypothetical protein